MKRILHICAFISTAMALLWQSWFSLSTHYPFEVCHIAATCRRGVV